MSIATDRNQKRLNPDASGDNALRLPRIADVHAGAVTNSACQVTSTFAATDPVTSLIIDGTACTVNQSVGSVDLIRSVLGSTLTSLGFVNVESPEVTYLSSVITISAVGDLEFGSCTIGGTAIPATNVAI